MALSFSCHCVLVKMNKHSDLLRQMYLRHAWGANFVCYVVNKKWASVVPC